MAKLIPIDDIDRLQTRPVGDVVEESRKCLTELKSCMASFGRAYPGCIAIAAIAGGEAHGIIVAAPFDKGCCYSVGTVTALRELALLIANLTAETDRTPDDTSPDFRAVFETAWAKEKARRLKNDLRDKANLFSEDAR